MVEQEEMTEKQAQQILREFAESRQNVHTFFTNIIKSDDTTKTGNLTQEELGLPKVPFRTFKQLALFSKEIYEDKEWEDYFRELAEIHTASSLSKDGFLVKLSVTQKKELSDMTPKQRKKNKGWFGGKSKDANE